MIPMRKSNSASPVIDLILTGLKETFAQMGRAVLAPDARPCLLGSENTDSFSSVSNNFP